MQTHAMQDPFLRFTPSDGPATVIHTITSSEDLAGWVCITRVTYSLALRSCTACLRMRQG